MFAALFVLSFPRDRPRNLADRLRLLMVAGEMLGSNRTANLL